MTRRIQRIAALSLAVAACARAPAPVRRPAPLALPTPLSHRATAPRTQVDRDNDFVRAWTAWTAGKRTEATTLFGKLFRELHSLATPKKPFTLVSGAAGTLTLAVSSDGAHGLVQSREGVYWFDRSGAALRYDAVAASSVAFVPGTSLAVLTDPDLTIIDAATFDRVFSAPHVMEAKASPSGKLVVYVESMENKTTFHIWDVTTRREQRAFDLRPGESWQLFSIGFSPDEKELYFELTTPGVFDELGNMMDAGEQHLVIVDQAGHRLDFPARLANSQPSFSSDGKYIAYGYATFDEKTGTAGKTILIDRATRKQITSAAVDFPTATQFSNSGKYLIVGALRELHILAVPSLRAVASTPELRPVAPGGDDMQDISGIEIVGADKAFWASTADGTTAVFRFPSGKLVWKGPEGTPAAPMPSASGVAFAVEGALVTIDDHFVVGHRPLTQAELDAEPPTLEGTLSARLESTVCTVGDRIFPIAACH